MLRHLEVLIATMSPLSRPQLADPCAAGLMHDRDWAHIILAILYSSADAGVERTTWDKIGLELGATVLCTQNLCYHCQDTPQCAKASLVCTTIFGMVMMQKQMATMVNDMETQTVCGGPSFQDRNGTISDNPDMQDDRPRVYNHA